MTLFIHSQTKHCSRPHTLEGVWLLIYAGIKGHVSAAALAWISVCVTVIVFEIQLFSPKPSLQVAICSDFS